MKNRYKISLLIVAIMLAFFMTIATSYAFWTRTVEQNGVNEVDAGCLMIELNDVEIDLNGNVSSTSINLENAYPMSDAKGLNIKPYTLTIKNVCSIKAKYTIIFNTINSSNLNHNHIKYHLIKTSPTETSMSPAKINSLESTNFNLDGVSIQNSYILTTGTLNGKNANVADSVTYNFRMWIDESVGNEVMDGTYEAMIAVYAEGTE